MAQVRSLFCGMFVPGELYIYTIGVLAIWAMALLSLVTKHRDPIWIHNWNVRYPESVSPDINLT